MSKPFTALGFGLAAWLVVGLLAWAASAPAAVGDLTYQDCIGDAIVPGVCDEAPEPALLGARPLAISPDGRSVYTATEGSAVLTHLTRAASGVLSFESCLTSENQSGCLDVPGPLIDAPRSLALSADGRSIYVSSSGRDAVEHYTRAPETGRPTYRSCVSSENGTAPCLIVPNNRLQGASGLAVDPRGGSVYVGVPTPNIFTELDRDRSGGEVDFAACYSDGGNGCEGAPAGALFGAGATAVSPDGGSIYVAGSEAVSWFDHGANGALRFRDCFTRALGPAGCKQIASGIPSHFSDLAVSPDGASLYVVSAEDDAILHFTRAADGRLDLRECFASDLPGCAPVPGQPLQLPTALAVSPDGKSVYVGSLDADSIAHFSPTSGGALTYAGCISIGRLPDDGCTRLPAAALTGLTDLVVSPDGASLYAVGQVSSTVVSFRRFLGEVPPAVDPPQPPRQQPSARCAGKRATIVGSGRAETLRGTPRRDVIAALGGNDTIRAGGGDDLVCGGAGKDTIVGASGRDEMLGGPGADVLRGGIGGDRCVGGPGRDEADCERGQGRRG